VNSQTISLFGDSLTLGRIGIPYHRFLVGNIEVRGIEGETFSAIAKRVERYLARHQPHTLVIQGGANDLLLSEASPLYNPKFPPVKDHALYRETLTQTLNKIELLAPKTRVIICSIPILGEDLTSKLNAQRKTRNKVLKEYLLERGTAVYCDITDECEQIITREQDSPVFPYFIEDYANFDRDAQFIQGDEERAALLSQERHLVVTVDGLHPNGRGARSIASPLAKLLVH